MNPIMKVGRARRPTPSLSSTAAANKGATAQRSHVTRLGFVVPRKVSRRYTAVPSAPIALPRYTQLTLITATVCCASRPRVLWRATILGRSGPLGSAPEAGPEGAPVVIDLKANNLHG